MAAEDYELDDQPVARGAQGKVYFGVRRADRQEVAVKLAGSDTYSVKALEQEMQVMAAMAERSVIGVVPFIEAIRLHGQIAMVMPRYPKTLAHWLARVIQQPDAYALDDVLARIAELARIVGDVHAVPWEGGTVVHRDIKPENIFLDDFGRPYLGDFGGAMAIDDELKPVELALFGTPMWAPLDQILPGQAIPDTTWDTYALCVLLYAAVTGARPAYQAEPDELLTHQGRELWNAAKMAVSTKDPVVRKKWHKQFITMRTGSTTQDLVDPTGRAALLDSDREAIESGVRHLAELAGVRPVVADQVGRMLWAVLVRGLSPLSHPSPPNRYRDAIELADALEDIRELGAYIETTQEVLDQVTTGEISRSVLIESVPAVPTLAASTPSLDTVRGSAMPWVAMGLLALALIFVGSVALATLLLG